MPVSPMHPLMALGLVSFSMKGEGDPSPLKGLFSVKNLFWASSGQNFTYAKQQNCEASATIPEAESSKYVHKPKKMTQIKVYP